MFHPETVQNLFSNISNISFDKNKLCPCFHIFNVQVSSLEEKKKSLSLPENPFQPRNCCKTQLMLIF